MSVTLKILLISQEVEETKLYMARWRDIKKGKVNKEESKYIKVADNLICAPIALRIKAFIIDMFMLMMPIMYITTYIIMDGRDDFQSSEIARWLTTSIFGLIIVLFWVRKGQTPGFKAYRIKIINSTTKELLSIKQAILRYFMFLVSAISIVGMFLPFFRKDKKTFQDLVSNTCVIVEDDEK